MEKKKISTKKLLETYGLLDDSIATMIWHMNIGSGCKFFLGVNSS